MRASCYQILGDFSSVNPLNDKIYRIEKYLRKDSQAKYRAIGIPVVDRKLIPEMLSKTQTAQIYRNSKKMSQEDLMYALEWEFNKMIGNNGLYQEIRKWEEAGEKEYVAFRKLVDAAAFLSNTRQISYFTSYKTSREAETALNDLTKMWVENRPDVITKTEKEGIVTLQIGNYSGASPALDELIREYYQIVIDQPPLNDFNWLRYYLFCDQMTINRKDLSDLLFYKLMKIPLLDKWMLEDTYIHLVHDRVQHITAHIKYEIEKNFSTNPILVTSKISNMKKWNNSLLEEFTNREILLFLEKKRTFFIRWIFSVC